MRRKIALNNKSNVRHRRKVQAQHHDVSYSRDVEQQLFICVALHVLEEKRCVGGSWTVHFILLYISIPLNSAVKLTPSIPVHLFDHMGETNGAVQSERNTRAMSLHQTDTPDRCPGERLCAALTLSRSFRWSHGLNTSFPSPSLLSFRHCSFSRSIRRYSPYSRPLSAGSCSPSHPQPCPCPCPWPCPDITAPHVSVASAERGE